MGARRLIEADAEALRALRLRALVERPIDFSGHIDEESAWPMDRWRAWIAENAWFGVDGPDGLLGAAYLRTPSLMKLRHNGWIHGMYVAPEARGTGAAAAIMAGIETQARDRGLLVLKLLTTAGNTVAERFYTRCGFVAYGREPASHCVDGAAYDSIEMAKALEPFPRAHS